MWFFFHSGNPKKELGSYDWTSGGRTLHDPSLGGMEHGVDSLGYGGHSLGCSGLQGFTWLYLALQLSSSGGMEDVRVQTAELHDAEG